MKSTCDAVMIFRPKGTIPPEDTRKFRVFFESGCHLVVASRNTRGARNEEDNRTSRPRKWGVCLLSFLQDSSKMIQASQVLVLRDEKEMVFGFFLASYPGFM
jgi:hypothetical protein